MAEPRVGWWTRLAHLVVLWAFAVAQPLFGDVDGFLLESFDRLDLLVFTLVTILLPAVLILPELVVARFSRPAAWALHLVWIGGLGAILASQVLVRGWSPSSEVQIPLALGLGAGIAMLYAAWDPARQVLTVLTPAPLVFAAAFLLFGNAAPVVLGKERRSFPSHGAKPVPVVLVVFDELPTSSLMDASGRIDRRAFPNFAALQRDATWFRNATTVQDETLAAVPAILTGRRLRPGLLPVAQAHRDSVFSLLAGTHRINASEGATRLCPESLCHTLGSGSRETRWTKLASKLERLSLMQWLPPAVTVRLFPSQPNSGDKAAQLDRWERRLPGKEPALHMIHMVLPHQPWYFYPSGHRYISEPSSLAAFGPSINEGNWDRDPTVADHGYQRHLLQLQYTDRLLGRLMRALRRTGLYDRSLLVVVADHGISFRPGGSPRAVTAKDVGGIAPVPLFVKRPGQHSPAVSNRLVRTIDVLPTIAALLGAKAERMDGQSVFAHDYRPSREIRVGSKKGDQVRARAEEILRQRKLIVRRRMALFGSHLEWLYAQGPARRLLGRKLAPGPGVHVARGSSVSLENLDPIPVGGGVTLLPGRLTGQVHGELAQAGRPLVVALRNKVVATTTLERSGGRFSAMLPESALGPGRVTPVVLAAKRSRGRWRLYALQSAP